jgi:hypothetical protein
VDFQGIVELIGQVVDALGVTVIVLGVVLATGAALRNLHRKRQARPTSPTAASSGDRSCSVWSSWSPRTSSAPSRWPRRSPTSASWP